MITDTRCTQNANSKFVTEQEAGYPLNKEFFRSNVREKLSTTRTRKRKAKRRRAFVIANVTWNFAKAPGRERALGSAHQCRQPRLKISRRKSLEAYVKKSRRKKKNKGDEKLFFNYAKVPL